MRWVFQPIEDVQVVALNARGDTVAVDRSVDQYKLYGIDNNGEVLVTFRLELPDMVTIVSLLQK